MILCGRGVYFYCFHPWVWCVSQQPARHSVYVRDVRDVTSPEVAGDGVAEESDDI